MNNRCDKKLILGWLHIWKTEWIRQKLCDYATYGVYRKTWVLWFLDFSISIFLHQRVILFLKNNKYIVKTVGQLKLGRFHCHGGKYLFHDIHARDWTKLQGSVVLLDFFMCKYLNTFYLLDTIILLMLFIKRMEIDFFVKGKINPTYN